MRWLVLAVIAACGRVGFDSIVPATGDAALPGGDANTMGTGTISGIGCPNIAGTMFSTVTTVWSVGMVEAANETDILLFDRPITCAYLSNGTSWDDSSGATIPNNAQFLLLQIDGGAPGAYALSGNPPAPGSHAGVGVYYQTIMPGTPTAICYSSSGTVNISTGGPGGEIGGDFTVQYGGAKTLTGTFAAAWCPSGWYP
jgi:hypothetical protein